MRVILVDNSKASRAVYTPMLIESLKELGCDVVVCSTRDDVADNLSARHSFDAIVLSGSSLNMSQSIEASSIAKDIMALLLFDDLPCLGVCFGMQLLSVVYGGKVERLEEERDGYQRVDVQDTSSPLLNRGIHDAFFHHQDVVTMEPPGFVVDGRCKDGTIASIRCDAKRRYGVQFHPERSKGPARAVLHRFLSVAHRDQIPISCNVSISRPAWQRIALLMGVRSIHKVAHDEELHPEVILRVWNSFRQRYQISSVLV